MVQKDDWKAEAAQVYHEKRRQLLSRREDFTKQIMDLNEKINEIQRQISNLDVGAMAFGLPVPGLTSGKAPIPRQRLFKDVALEKLKEAYPKPLKAAQLKEAVERQLGRTVHPKTPGMSLYRLAQDKLVRREGHKWYFVPKA